MLEKSYRNKSIIPLGFFVVLGATMAFAILLQSPPLAFADDLSEGVTDATQTDVPVVVPSPAPPTTDISPAPVAPVESVAGGGAATGSIAVAPPGQLRWHGQVLSWLVAQIGQSVVVLLSLRMLRQGMERNWRHVVFLRHARLDEDGVAEDRHTLVLPGEVRGHEDRLAQVRRSWYYLKPSGAMAASTWIDDYYVDAGGAWVPNKTK